MDGSPAGIVSVVDLETTIARSLGSAGGDTIEVVTSCEAADVVAPGDVFVCSATAEEQPGTDWGQVVVTVVDEQTFA